MLNKRKEFGVPINRRKLIKSGLVLGVGAAVLPLWAKPSEKTITILHTNDWHSRIEPFPQDGGRFAGLGGAAKRAKIILEIREEVGELLLLDAGDVFQGTPYFNHYKGELELKLMSQMGYDVVTLGNHDFDLGVNGLLNALPHAKYQLVNVNYQIKNSDLKQLVKPYVIKNVKDVKVGIFGLGIDLNGLLAPNQFEGILYQNPIPLAQEITDELRKLHKCQLVICLSHLGFQYQTNKISDQTLAKEVNGIDVIIGGHTHTFLNQPMLTSAPNGKNVWICQAGWGGIQLGRLDIKLSDQQTIANPHSTMHKVS